MNKEQIEDAMMNLSSPQRAELASKLLISLEEESETEIQDSWIIEAKRRASELEAGLVEPISAQTVREKAKELLR